MRFGGAARLGSLWAGMCIHRGRRALDCYQIGIDEGRRRIFHRDIRKGWVLKPECAPRRLMLGGLGVLVPTTARAKPKFTHGDQRTARRLSQGNSRFGLREFQSIWSLPMVPPWRFSQADAIDLGDYRGQFRAFSGV